MKRAYEMLLGPRCRVRIGLEYGKVIYELQTRHLWTAWKRLGAFPSRQRAVEAGMQYKLEWRETFLHGKRVVAANREIP